MEREYFPEQYSGGPQDVGREGESLEIPNRRRILEAIAEELKVDIQTPEGVQKIREEIEELRKLMSIGRDNQ